MSQLPILPEFDAWVEQYLDTYYARARNEFGLFRQLIHPDFAWGWWTDEVSRELNRFSHDLIQGRRPKLALMAPPQHGKSLTVWDFVAWIAGKHPDLKTIFASYSDELGMAANRHVFRMIRDNEVFRKIFPRLQVGGAGWNANANLIEYVGHTGSFRNTTVEGAINGFRLDLGIIDDPVKGRAEVNSKLVRDKVWDWFADDFFTRFSKDAGFLIIMTRWHIDDVLGRFLERFSGEVRVLRYPALAEQTSRHFKKELIVGENGRGQLSWKEQLVRRGEPLFPELKPLDFLLERKKLETQASWESLFQQNPISVGGGQLPIDKLKVMPYLDRAEVIASVRYWDKASSDSGNAAYTAGVLMHKLRDKTFVIGHIARGRWSALERERRMKAYTEADHKLGTSYCVYVEQEPGSGGKESAENTIRNLPGLRVYADRVTGSKEVRAQPFAAQVQGGNVFLLAGDWVRPFLDECEMWPNGKYKDQVDAAAGAFNKLTTSSFDTTWSWV